MEHSPTSPHLLRAATIDSLPETIWVHPLNPKVIRHTKSLGDLVGMKNLGFHLVRVAPGDETTEYHCHHQEEEFIYILSGRGMAQISEQQIEVGAGDFMGFTAPSLPHAMTNPFTEDLVYLMGGQRLDPEMVDYPHLRKRQFRFGGVRQLVDWENLVSREY